MTHACIKIFNWGENRHLILHTYHSGMDTVEWVKSIPAFFAVRRGAFLWESSHPPKTKKNVANSFNSFVHRGQFSYAPSVAALLIAVKPDCYEPVPEIFQKDMAKWSGLDDPYVLRIVNENQWLIHTPSEAEDAWEEIHPVDEAIKALWNLRKKK